MRARLALVLAVSLLGAACLRAPAAEAVTFGANLSVPANNVGTCAQLMATSCTFFSGAPGPSFYAPASGTVTTVRVKVGAITGPMQIVVLRSLYQNKFGDPGHPYYACCFVQRYGPTFTPKANAITPVATSLPVVEDPTPPPDDYVTNARGDFLALSVLAPNVPFPANFDGTSGYSGLAPAPNPATTPAPSPNPILPASNGFGYRVLMNADLDTGATGDGGQGQTTPTGIAPLTIASGGQLVGSTASIPLKCVLTTACEGVLRLTDRAPAAQTAATRRVRTLGRKRFSIAAGKTKRVKVKLNRAGRRKARRRSTLPVYATTKIGSKVVTKRVKLKRKRRR